MTVRLPSISTSTSVPVDGFAICNSRGRRVSLLNDDDEPFTLPLYGQSSSPNQYPLSPAHTSDSDPAEHPYTPVYHYNHSPAMTPPSASPLLPPINDLISFTVPNYDTRDLGSRKSSLSSLSLYSRRESLASSTSSRRGSNHSSQSKGSKRRYECATCGKTFTTSGHVARHNRIHTGEKNFQCPEPGCSQRFSRQDNCMQHYRTHKNHAQTRPEPPHSPRATPPLSSSHRNKRRRTAEEEQSEEVSVDPNDRLSAFATYISVYA